ncbi:MAG TPA: hypothetical protein VGI99_10275, partial [Gemmataceae bacterium]
GVNQPPTVFIFQAFNHNLIGSFTAGDTNNLSGIAVDVTAANAQNGDRSIFIAPLAAAAGATRQQYDPWQFMDPANPVGSASLGTDVNEPQSTTNTIPLNGLNLGNA